MHVGQHQAGLQRWALLVVQPLDGAGHRAFGIRLRGRRHAGQHAHAGALQHAFRVVVRQLAPHQVHIGREAIGRDQAGLGGHAQRRGQCALVFGRVDQVVFVQLAQHEIAPIQRPLRVTPRVVVGRPLDQPDQQGDLLGGHRIELAAEPQLRARGHAVDRLPAALAQVDLVEIGLQDGALVVTRLHDHRVQDLVELAGEGLFLADAEQAAACQLLGQGAGALADLAAGARHDPGRAHHAAQVDAVVAVEVAVLDRLQAGDQQLGHFFHAHQAAFFLLLPVQRGDARRIQPRTLERLAVAGVA